MAKKILGYIKLQVPAGNATPSPPIGPALGQRGVNIMGFVKEFNARTEKEVKGTPLPTVITVGRGVPLTSFSVRALNSLTKPMMLTPRWPRAGPIGGEGVALPAGTCSLI